MAKNKRAGSITPANKKKVEVIPAKKVTRKVTPKIDDKKVKLISDKLNQINKNFETLIEECQVALKNLTEESAVRAY